MSDVQIKQFFEMCITKIVHDHDIGVPNDDINNL